MTSSSLRVRDALHRDPTALVAGLAVTFGGPLMVLAIIYHGGTHETSRMIELIAGLLAIIAVARRPAVGLLVMLAFLPLQPVLLPALLRIGLPGPIVRGLGAVSTVIVAGLLIAAIAEWQRSDGRLDLADRLALIYIAIASFYIVLPMFAGSLFSRVTLPTSLTVRVIAWRIDTLYVIAFVAARRLVLSRRAKRAIVGVLLVSALLVGVGGFIEEFASTTWNHFLVSTLQVPRYDLQILNQQVTDPKDLLFHSPLDGRNIVRVGSLLQSPLTVGFYLLTALGVGLHRLSLRRVEPLVALIVGVIAATIVFTVTRDAVLGGLVAAVVIFVQGVRRQSPGRVRIGVSLIAVAIAVAPFAASSTLGQRTTASSSQGQDTQDHSTSTFDAYHDLFFVPFGRGLGTSAAVGNRFAVVGTVTTENSYLQVGDELGIAEMLVFIALFVALLFGLLRAPPDPDLSPDALFAAGVGLAVSGLFLQVWVNYPTSLTFWSVAGLALGITRAPATRDAHANRMDDPVSMRTAQMSER